MKERRLKGVVRTAFRSPGSRLVLPLATREVVARLTLAASAICRRPIFPVSSRRLSQRGIPFVALRNNVALKEASSPQFDAVFSDDIQGAREMTAYFRQLGHQEIWFVGNTSLPWANRCYEGYCQAMKEAGLPPHLSEIDSTEDIEVGYLGTKSVLSDGLPVTAVLGATDETAQGVYRALGGLQTPNDARAAGCNDGLGSLLNPPMTTIREFPQL